MAFVQTIAMAACSVLVLGSVGVSPARAEDGGRSCAAIDDDAARLNCYDRIFRVVDRAEGTNAATPAAVSPAAATGAAAVPGTAAAPGPAPAAAQDFGLTEAQKQAREPEKSRGKGPASITATIKSIQTLRDGQVVVILDNDQVWIQNDPAIRVYLNDGDKVEIRKAALGSHVLVPAGRPAVRVRRVR